MEFLKLGLLHHLETKADWDSIERPPSIDCTRRSINVGWSSSYRVLILQRIWIAGCLTASAIRNWFTGRVLNIGHFGAQLAVAAIEKEWGRPWVELRRQGGTNAQAITFWFLRYWGGMKLEQVKAAKQKLRRSRDAVWPLTAVSRRYLSDIRPTELRNLCCFVSVAEELRPG